MLCHLSDHFVCQPPKVFRSPRSILCQRSRWTFFLCRQSGWAATEERSVERTILYCSRGSSIVDTGCTVVRLCCCTVVRLYVCSIVQFCTVVPTPHTVGSTHGCTHGSMHGLHAGTVVQKWLSGFVYTQPTHPHSKRRFFIFFVIPRSSRYFLPTDPRGYRTPTFWWEILGEDARTPIPIISNSTETQATIIPLI